jgi:NO-binding membrane sensor protein with MHYT domain
MDVLSLAGACRQPIGEGEGPTMPEGAEQYHFTFGLITPAFSYAFSVLGSLLALVCTARAQTLTEPKRKARWLVLAAWSLGGTGIWVMHFMAMLGFTVPNSPVRYDVGLTVTSWIAAILVTGFGLFIAGFGKPSVLKVILGGMVTGSGVAIMHYFGMAAMNVNGSVGHDRRFVAAAGAIAIIACIVALWFTVTLRRGSAIAIAALIMGVAVNGMHYTGMAGVRVHLHTSGGEVEGVSALQFLGPMMMFVVLVVITLAYALLRSTDMDTGWTYGQKKAEEAAPVSPPVGIWAPSQRGPAEPAFSDAEAWVGVGARPLASDQRLASAQRFDAWAGRGAPTSTRPR